MRQHSIKLLFLCFVLITVHVSAQEGATYKLPPKEMMDLVLAKSTPGVSIDGKGNWMILMQRSEFPSVEELAKPEYKIAGIRIDPMNFSPSRGNYMNNLQLKNIKTKEVIDIDGLPSDLHAGNVRWSPDETQFAFTNTTSSKVDLYSVTLADHKAKKINKTALNVVLGAAYDWLDNSTILYKVIVADASKFPAKPPAPTGPAVQEASGKAGNPPTYQDLLKNQYDEALFEFFATSQIVKNAAGVETNISKPAIYTSINPSPDLKYLMVSQVKRPFSYLVPYRSFATTIQVLSASGDLVKKLADNPAEDARPNGYDNVVPYARNFQWRDDQPATIVYVKALDNGLGKNKVEFRDAVMQMGATEEGEGKLLLKTKTRFREISWGNETTALVVEGLQSTKRTKTSLFNPATGAMDSLFEKSTTDRYNDFGRPVTEKNQFGREVLWISKDNHLLTTSPGESPEGQMPLVASFDLKTKKSTILWRCQAPYFETVVTILDPAIPTFVTSRESQTEAPNYYIRDMRKKSLIGTPITDFPNPYPQLDGIKKEKISYKRADGISLTAELYLPKNYDQKKDGPLPVFIWAYPAEYTSAADAAQVRGSKYTFVRLGYSSPIYWVTQGYAILNNAEMPIVGQDGAEPNDSFVPQLYMNAHAAIQTLAKMGVGDSNRVAVGGHSYGAFMTANLLAHTSLFKGGIAQSGAYNRSLTPFGFQNETRTYWQAPEVYGKMSPFNYADSIKTPLLLIHGDADDNTGTFPIQSERLYNAVKGHGGTVKLVFLPYEAHGYRGKENILHMLWEQTAWLDKYVKNAPALVKGGTDPQRKPF